MKHTKKIIGIISLIALILFSGCSRTPDEWCSNNLPEFNISGNKNIEYCFNEGWDNYCKISYPESCPNNNYSDYDRCIANCNNYGINECPCDNIFKQTYNESLHLLINY